MSRAEVPPLPSVGLPGTVAPDEEFIPVSSKTAREINASRPFSTAKVVPARPFRHSYALLDEERAVACLATAAVYEAGGNSSDQSAVMQVVLNRARHPAFPSTVCGVVFQGSERSTGCQFSFTCDGSMVRRQPAPFTWRAAINLARAMLNGYVDSRVGLSTHYHTDWVVPYWSASLEKITSVRTHLFFRWQGYWGMPSAFRRAVSTKEPTIRVLSGIFPSHAQPDELSDDSPSASATSDGTQIALSEVGSITTDRTAKEIEQIEVRRLALPAGTGAARWSVRAVSVCSDAAICRVVGWSDSSREPSQITRASLSQAPPDLVFVKIARNRQQQAYWDCEKWPQASGSRCLGGPSDIAALIFAE